MMIYYFWHLLFKVKLCFLIRNEHNKIYSINHCIRSLQYVKMADVVQTENTEVGTEDVRRDASAT